jgi:hypothetical protein
MPARARIKRSQVRWLVMRDARRASGIDPMVALRHE